MMVTDFILLGLPTAPFDNTGSIFVIISTHGYLYVVVTYYRLPNN